MDVSTEKETATSWIDRPLTEAAPRISLYTLAVVVILLLTAVSRFYHVDLRVMAHDEVNHVVPAYELYQGNGYRHDPITHGPFQFHALALSYFLLGDSDFSARVPAVLFSIATVAAVLLLYPRYLGRSGALVAGVLFMISPFMLFYGRYVRNEAFVAFYGVVMLYSVLRYLDRGDRLSLFLLTGMTALHFATKETAFIYQAQLLIFLAVLFIRQVLQLPWAKPERRRQFLTLVLTAIAGLVLTLGFAVWNARLKGPGAAEAAEAGLSPLQIAEVISLTLAFAAGVAALVILLRSLGLKAVRSQRSFDLLILSGTMVLPQLSPFPVKILATVLKTGWNPLNYNDPGSVLVTGVFIALLTIIAVAIGIWWNRKLWLLNFTLFYGIFIVLYTTFFTNPDGFLTGLVGSLGYWLNQQAEERGSQPMYYYLLVQIPVYEYLAALGTLLAADFALRFKRFSTVPGYAPAAQPQLPEATLPATDPEKDLADSGYTVNPPELISSPRAIPVLTLLLYWVVTSAAAYSVAGERMPWLTVHIALPMLLCAGWGIGFLIDTTPWRHLANRKGLLALILLAIFTFSLGGVFRGLLGEVPAFQGNTIDELRATGGFLLALAVSGLSIAGFIYLLRGWQRAWITRLLVLAVVGGLGILTARASARASYVNYDYPYEYLVYAHAAPGPKLVLSEVEEISRRVTGGKAIVVAYDSDALYPFWWYLRDYPNKRWYGDEPDRSLRDAPLIIAGDDTMSRVDSITGDEYLRFNYKRLWWPNQDYYNLSWRRVFNALTNQELLSALANIWLNRDYSDYAALKGDENLARLFTLENWSPSENLRFYVRKDIAAQMWDYGLSETVSPAEETDPYASQMVDLSPDLVVGGLGADPGRLNTPHGFAFAPDGSIYIADALNHRIQHLNENGEVLHIWGTYASLMEGAAPGGTFYEPWSVAVGPDGSVYVADTWNHRIQKFTADGQFITMWGYFGQAEAPDAFWGPRDLAIDAQGRLYVVDTGNDRVVVFDPDGNFITQFGTEGFDPGFIDEPMGIALDAEGNVYLADTWNQRMQVFSSLETGFTYLRHWDITGWFGTSLQNYPFVAVSPDQHVFVTDPEGYRVLEFTANGEFVRGWGGYSPSSDGFGLASAVRVDSQGRVWVSDAGNHMLLRFNLPAEIP